MFEPVFRLFQVLIDLYYLVSSGSTKRQQVVQGSIG